MEWNYYIKLWFYANLLVWILSRRLVFQASSQAAQHHAAVRSPVVLCFQYIIIAETETSHQFKIFLTMSMRMTYYERFKLIERRYTVLKYHCFDRYIPIHQINARIARERSIMRPNWSWNCSKYYPQEMQTLWAAHRDTFRTATNWHLQTYTI